jgi:hypothetical protein
VAPRAGLDAVANRRDCSCRPDRDPVATRTGLTQLLSFIQPFCVCHLTRYDCGMSVHSDEISLMDVKYQVTINAFYFLGNRYYIYLSKSSR